MIITFIASLLQKARIDSFKMAMISKICGYLPGFVNKNKKILNKKADK